MSIVVVLKRCHLEFRLPHHTAFVTVSRRTLRATGDRVKLPPVEQFDYILIGAGSAGCVLAERLSASGRERVLVLEAGGSDSRFWIKTPIGYGRTFADPAVNWK
jgi:hypothetical protein